jgi:hypothetical protein
MVELTIELDGDVALRRAQFCKRAGLQTFLPMVEEHLSQPEKNSAAYQMMYGMEEIRRALAEANVSPH